MNGCKLMPGEFPRELVFTRICHVKQGYDDRRRHIVKE